ncbi:N-acetylmuramoyl-L-alanine amidase [Actinomycetospora endophytica]|uniref:N-acetylmuramoyl-L-alanine amidase n=1 Tax=Actinomycetospora endophytica TaxID=2291215 RepID=A0ABS8P695_9PSEU|nr:N-acetylmuramoyl-L-alanine amidase [Actinomycetospora endophytica]MCD2193785.1 N-acetylmuramoyl-L-alanine amidase [Actinomycetospora endophytica]
MAATRGPVVVSRAPGTVTISDVPSPPRPPRAALVATLVAVLCSCAGPGSAPASSTAPLTTPPAAPPSSSAPAPSAAAPPSARPGAFGLPPGATIVVDPGHNGRNGPGSGIDRPVPDGRGGTKPCNTTGASTADGYAEHAFTWAVSQKLADRLRARGYKVVLTRDSDDGVGPCVDVRGEAGAKAGAAAVVSVHADGGPTSGHGFHVLYSAPPLNAAQRGPARGLADALVTSMRGAGFTPATYIGRGGLDGRADIAGLNLATVPSALVECANLRNPADAALARSPQGQQRFADAIAAALG